MSGAPLVAPAATASPVAPVAPVVQESTPSIIASRIREAIASGAIAPGSQVGEAEFARMLGVSRGPLREGLQRLVQEGLLAAHRNRGHFVVEMTPETVMDMYLARAAVERAAAAEAHRLDPTGTAAALFRVIDRMKAADARGDEHAVSGADIEFHRVLVESSRSPRLARIHETLMTETRMCIHALESTYGASGGRVDEHSQIAESFAEGDPERSDRLLVEHMREAIERLGQIPG